MKSGEYELTGDRDKTFFFQVGQKWFKVFKCPKTGLRKMVTANKGEKSAHVSKLTPESKDQYLFDTKRESKGQSYRLTLSDKLVKIVTLDF
jgi:hypothetical protein